MARKRKAVTEDDDEALQELSDDSSEEVLQRATRNRRPTVKQAKLNLDAQRAAVDKQFRELKEQMKVIQKAAKELREGKQVNLAFLPEQPENSTASPELDVESEEEDGDVLRERQNESKFKSRGLYPAPLPAGQRLRREGEKAMLRTTSAAVSATSSSGSGDSTAMSALMADQATTESTSSSVTLLAIAPAPSGSSANPQDAPSFDDSASRGSSVSLLSSTPVARVRALQSTMIAPTRTPDHIAMNALLYVTVIALKTVTAEALATATDTLEAAVALGTVTDAAGHALHATTASGATLCHTLMARVPGRNGKVPSGKPKASHYEPRVAKLVNHACHQFEVLLATEQPFPEPGVSVQWATRVWTDVCHAVQMNYVLSDSIEKVITARASHARGVLRDKIRPLIAQTYGFISDGTERAKVKNIALYTSLLDRDAQLEAEPRFHYKDVETKQGFAQNKIITTVNKAQWFADTGAAGVKYSSQFSPLREVTIAFIFTTIEFCLDQWASGHYDKHLTYSDKVYRPKYAVHLQHVKDWCDINCDATRAIRQRMYDRARRSSGAPPEMTALSGLSDASRDRLRLEIEAQATAQASDDDD
ncbi:uncharacterized protein TRAVEDRAFT_43078 [Trametes versicolor FP-101664 SS1]|uniref:uncharacterized protein n=1 Tax=Trametes versicolor (strain FP-101664) TaxID=717944 RepID=UPI0004623F96|nr:uncharacterized protein TRAVEDRAFT_43078 [Trametes versicolor FP-101664 SS1]EIW62746.1 hypothetical protein TRAVEDRAFT_43078 [Trametes versicolor FP-101664 SS1]